MRILLVEDDRRIAADVATALRVHDYLVDTESDGEKGWFKGDTEDYAAIVLDLGLPGMDGLTVLKRWRQAGCRTPVLVLTACGSWIERVEGIDAGADDYLPKPFELDELLARLRAVLRRSAGQADAVLRSGEVSLDTRLMWVTRRGVSVSLAPQEYRLVQYLMHHSGRVGPQQEMSEHLQAEHFQRESNAVEVLVGRVRRKLGGDFMETRRGFGYCISGVPNP